MSAMARRRHQARGIEPTTSASWPAAWPVEISRSHELPAERPFMDVALLRVLFAQASLAGVLLIGEAGAGPSRLPDRTDRHSSWMCSVMLGWPAPTAASD